MHLPRESAADLQRSLDLWSLIGAFSMEGGALAGLGRQFRHGFALDGARHRPPRLRAGGDGLGRARRQAGRFFWSGLTVGLIEEDGVGLPGFNGLAQVHKAITSEARLATAPVVQEFASSSHSNGNLDRAGMATFAARKTQEVASLCRSIAGVELMVAAQATQSPKATPLGEATGKLFALVREAVPFAAAGDRVPHLDPLLRHVEARRKEIDALVGADG